MRAFRQGRSQQEGTRGSGGDQRVWGPHLAGDRQPDHTLSFHTAMR